MTTAAIPAGYPVALGPSRADYVLVLLMICLSGNLAFSSGARADGLLLLCLLFAGYRLVQLGLWQSRLLFMVLGGYVLLFLFQGLSLNFFAPVTVAGVFVRLLVAACVVAAVRWFRLVFVQIMVRLVVLSLVFHIPTFLAGMVGVRIYEAFRPIAGLVGAVNTGVNERVNIIVHNFMGDEQFLRNAGIFWEPGAFSGYIIMALILLATFQQDLPRKTLRRWIIILSVGLLSTMSTTGYAIFPLALFTFTLSAANSRRDGLRKLIYAVLFILLMIPIAVYVWQLEFIGAKVIELYDRAIYREAGWELSRFGAAIFDWAYITERPFLGWGKSNETQFALNPELEDLRLGNGFTGYLRQMGLLGLGLFLLATGYSLGRCGVTIEARIWILFTLCVLLNGQYYMDYPMLLAFQFLALERRPITTLPPIPAAAGPDPAPPPRNAGLLPEPAN